METIPSFLAHKDVLVDVPTLGQVGEVVGPNKGSQLTSQVKLDLAFGGMWFAVVAADQVEGRGGLEPVIQVGLLLEPGQGKKIARLGEMIKVLYFAVKVVPHV